MKNFESAEKSQEHSNSSLLLPPYSDLIEAVKTRLEEERNSRPESSLALILSMLAEQGGFNLEVAIKMNPEKATELTEAYEEVHEYIKMAERDHEGMVTEILEKGWDEMKPLVVTFINDKKIKAEGRLRSRNDDGTYGVDMLMNSDSGRLPDGNVFIITKRIQLQPKKIIDIQEKSFSDTVRDKISKALDGGKKMDAKVKFRNEKDQIIEGMVISMAVEDSGQYAVMINATGATELPRVGDVLISKKVAISPEKMVEVDGEPVAVTYLLKG